MGDMQRFCGTLLTLLPGVLAAQQSAGTELWRLAATTLPIPPALATGGAAAFWNPAQPAGPERGSVALDCRNRFVVGRGHADSVGGPVAGRTYTCITAG